jgi:hypothetical protein
MYTQDYKLPINITLLHVSGDKILSSADIKTKGCIIAIHQFHIYNGKISKYIKARVYIII